MAATPATYYSVGRLLYEVCLPVKRKIMRIKSIIAFFYLSVALQPLADAQNQQDCEGLYVVFSSECCGINREALQKLDSLEKILKPVINKTSLYFGKEGEMLLLLTKADTGSFRFANFAAKVMESIPGKYRLVTVHSFLEYSALTNIYWIHSPPYELNTKNETAWLAFLKKYETKYGVQLFNGWMINETQLEVDQDKRTMIDLGKLPPEARPEFINTTRNLLAAKPGQ